MNEKQSGFTIIEILIVLSVSLVLLTLSTTMSIKIYHHFQYQYFLTQWNQDLLWMQQNNLISTTPYYLTLDRDHNRYHVRKVGYGQTVLTRSYPRNWSIASNTLQFPIEFSHRGYLKKPGTLTIQTGTNKYFLTCPLGKGRCYSEKAN
ncbi:hypothetical protein J416_05593 [Gracilibacillus halophilus YIM-C55.5]|uniref:ComG operon protein 4 n=1 Tax=Gracilibacillus halophilus YIM-C55.5 TaxID=1308866 RepID=N4WDY3_9BACI|nr:hypothetical protein J416_05593 [Gracilibacillus halophilus YIM-C55.5]